MTKRGTTPSETRGDLAMVLAADVARRIHGETFGGLAETAPSNVRAQNLYTPGMADRGVTQWVVTWEQAAAFDPLVDPATLDALLLIHADINTPRSDAYNSVPETTVEVPLEPPL